MCIIIVKTIDAPSRILTFTVYLILNETEKVNICQSSRLRTFLWMCILKQLGLIRLTCYQVLFSRIYQAGKVINRKGGYLYIWNRIIPKFEKNLNNADELGFLKVPFKVTIWESLSKQKVSMEIHLTYSWI